MSRCVVNTGEYTKMECDTAVQLYELVMWWFGMRKPPRTLDDIKADPRTVWEELWFNKGADIDAMSKRWSELLTGDGPRFDPHAAPTDDVVTMGLMLLYDQVPRNAFRGTSNAYQYDCLAKPVALYLAKRVVDGNLSSCPNAVKLAVMLCLVHDEDATSQALAQSVLKTCDRLDVGLYSTAQKVCERHTLRVELFGRIPERARIKGVSLTEPERAFLDAL